MKRSQEEKRKEKKKKNKEEGTEKLTKIEAKQTTCCGNH